jgi:hypothetical protein
MTPARLVTRGIESETSVTPSTSGRDRDEKTAPSPRAEYRGRELDIGDLSGNRTLVRFGSGHEVTVQAGPEGARFLLVAGPPHESLGGRRGAGQAISSVQTRKFCMTPGPKVVVSATSAASRP